MTIKELKQKIADLPDNMDVFVDERKSDFKYGLINSGYVKEINFLDDGLDIIATESVFILDEE